MSDELSKVLSGLDASDKLRLLSQALGKKVPLAFSDSKQTAAELKKRYERLTESQTLSAGQLVMWKRGLKNKRRPEVGEPAIVVECLSEPVYDHEKSTGSAYFREPLDIILGVFDDDEDFNLFYFDSRRFEPIENAADESEQ